MAHRRHRQHSGEFKLAALARLDTATDVQALARELDIERGLLYRWQRTYIEGGAAALRSMGRPRPILMGPSATTASAAENPAPSLPAEANPSAPLAGEEPRTLVAASAPPPEASLAAHDPTAAARRIAELERKA